MSKKEEKLTPEKMLLDGLIEARSVWYKSNERKAELYERRLNAMNIWANKVVLYILMQQRIQNGSSKNN